MTQKERKELIEFPAEEVLQVVSSMQDLVLLADHYNNPKETRDFLIQMSVCTTKLEAIIHRVRNHITE